MWKSELKQNLFIAQAQQNPSREIKMRGKVSFLISDWFFVIGAPSMLWFCIASDRE